MIERWINWYQEMLITAGLTERMALVIENITVILITIGLENTVFLKIP